MEKKPFWQSKIVWLAFVGLLLALAGHFGYQAPEGTAEQIVDQDWSNLVTAGINAVIIVARVFFTNKTIGSPS